MQATFWYEETPIDIEFIYTPPIEGRQGAEASESNPPEGGFAELAWLGIRGCDVFDLLRPEIIALCQTRAEEEGAGRSMGYASLSMGYASLTLEPF